MTTFDIRGPGRRGGLRKPSVIRLMLAVITLWNDEHLTSTQIATELSIDPGRVTTLIQDARARGYTVERRQ